MSYETPIPEKERRYKCADCGKFTVQTSFPTWYYEGRTYELELIEPDSEADPHFYCDTCGDVPSDVIDYAEGT